MKSSIIKLAPQMGHNSIVSRVWIKIISLGTKQISDFYIENTYKIVAIKYFNAWKCVKINCIRSESYLMNKYFIDLCSQCYINYTYTLKEEIKCHWWHIYLGMQFSSLNYIYRLE